LQDIYELDITHRIENYLVSNKALVQLIHSSKFNRHTKEKLLVYEDEEGLNLSLYLDDKILKNYLCNDPFNSLNEHNVQEFCLVLEGISHFLYLVWNATYDRSVTLLEMELQAEVDKFIMVLDCLECQSNSPAPGQLSRLLFETNIYHDDLSNEEIRRYKLASNYAREYCKQLESRFLGEGNRIGLLSELRKFYRLTKPGKIDRIIRSY
jgi:hypothetical protein